MLNSVIVLLAAAASLLFILLMPARELRTPLFIFIAFYTLTTMAGGGVLLDPWGFRQFLFQTGDNRVADYSTLGAGIYWFLLIAPVFVIPLTALFTFRVGSTAVARSASLKSLFKAQQDIAPLAIYGVFAAISAFCVYRLAAARSLFPTLLFQEAATCSDRILRRTTLVDQLGTVFYSFVYSSLPILSCVALSWALKTRSRWAIGGFLATFVGVCYFYSNIYSISPFIIYFIGLALTVFLHGYGFIRSAVCFVGLAVPVFILLAFAIGCYRPPEPTGPLELDRIALELDSPSFAKNTGHWMSATPATTLERTPDGLKLNSSVTSHSYILASQVVRVQPGQRYTVKGEIDISRGALTVGVLDTTRDKWVVNAPIAGTRISTAFEAPSDNIQIIFYNGDAKLVGSTATLRAIAVAPEDPAATVAFDWGPATPQTTIEKVADGLRMTSSASELNYTVVSAPLHVEKDVRYRLELLVDVTRGALSVGVLDIASDGWIATTPIEGRETELFFTPPREAVQIIFYNGKRELKGSSALLLEAALGKASAVIAARPARTPERSREPAPAQPSSRPASEAPPSQGAGSTAASPQPPAPGWSDTIDQLGAWAASSADKAQLWSVTWARNIGFRMASAFPYYVQLFSDPAERCGLDRHRGLFFFVPEPACTAPLKVHAFMYPTITHVQGWAPAAAHVSAYAQLGGYFAAFVLVAAGAIVGLLGVMSRYVSVELKVAWIVSVSLFCYYLGQIPLDDAIVTNYGLGWMMAPVIVALLAQKAVGWRPAQREAQDDVLGPAGGPAPGGRA